MQPLGAILTPQGIIVEPRREPLEPQGVLEGIPRRGVGLSSGICGYLLITLGITFHVFGDVFQIDVDCGVF